MARKVAQTTLNASSIDIINVIRANAPAEYQNLVPKVETAADIPKVGAVIYGHPAFANTFLNALINRIALVRMNSATFNNPYAPLKKGVIEFGESIEDIFVNIVKVHTEDAEKADEREFKRTLPDVRSVFHVINFRVVYPITVQDEDLYTAFNSIDGVTDLITKIVDSVYTSAEYDEFLLFKYLIIKAANEGVIKSDHVKVSNVTDMTEADNKAFAKKFRSYANKFKFMSDRYNHEGVPTTTPRARQCIFMDSDFNASYDVDVLAQAFNMDKADFVGKLYLIDDFTTFDNERFSVLRKESDGLEEVTQAELANMAKVKAILFDDEFFQVYDNKKKMTEKYVASGMYWNYFYHNWKTVSFSPFANAIAFVADTATEGEVLPESITVKVESKDVSDVATVFTFALDEASANTFGKDMSYTFAQTQECVTNKIAVQKYGAMIIPASASSASVDLVVNIGGTAYTSTAKIGSTAEVGATFTLNK